MVGSSTFGVIEDPSTLSCDYVPLPNREVLAAGGGSASVVFHANPGCPWTATSGAGWLTVAQSTISGIGTITLRAAANSTGAVRTTTVLAAGRTVSVVQPNTGTVGSPPGACGAVDVTSQFSFHSSGTSPVGFGNWNEYTETITITNNGPPVALPVLVVLVGEPTANGYPYDSLLYGGSSSSTHCFTPTGFGDYLVLPGPQGPSGSTTMPSGQIAGAPLLWYVDTFASMPRYRPIIISGTPQK